MEAKDFTFKAILDPQDLKQLVDEIVAGLLTKLPSNLITDSQPKEQEAPISKKEVCRLLRCSEPTMTKWMASGKIPFRRKGRRVYFFKSEVLKSLEQPLNGRKEGKRCKF